MEKILGWRAILLSYSVTVSPAYLDWFLFLASLALAYIFSWSSKDLLWSFWIGSFFMGCLAAGLNAMKKVTIDPGQKMIGTIILVIFGLVAFCAHGVFFGMFYGVFGAMMDLLSPLQSHPDRVYIGHLTWRGGMDFSLWTTFKLALSNYWPWLILMPLGRLKKNGFEEYYRTEIYWDLLRMHFLMFILMIIGAYEMKSFWVYVIISGWFFLVRTRATQPPIEKVPQSAPTP
jgi:hypothetical protein